MKLRAIKGVIAVRMDEGEDTVGGIQLLKREEVQTGTVVTAGPGIYDSKGKFTPNPVKDGDRVIIAKGSGIKVTVLDEELLFVTPNEITGIIRE